MPLNPSNFFAELKRRRVYRVAIGYAIAAWLVVQIGSTILPTFHVPEWILQALIVLVALGFPVALVLAWAFDITPSGIEKTSEGSYSTRNRRNGWLLGAAGLVIACLAIGAYSLWHRSPVIMSQNGSISTPPISATPNAPSRPTTSGKSIAVLPFENLSRDPDNAFFASGIQDEILTSLAKISGLKVVSRTSTARYQSSPENLSDIARGLGVAHILEGSVQKAGEKVHVNVQLIRADTDAHIWAESYDRSLADIFAVEAEVARSVADELRATLSPDEKVRVATKPTENSEAYVLYLRANELVDRPSDFLEDMQKGVALYEQAIALDPAFAIAHARLSGVLAHIYLNFQSSEAIGTRARAEAEESLRLQPDLGEGHRARGMCFYWTQKNYDAALRELQVAQRLLPNAADIESDIAYIYRRQGRWRDALAGMEHSLTRDPHDVPTAHEYWHTLCCLHRWPEARRAAARVVAIGGALATIKTDLAYTGVWERGDVAELRATIAAVPRGNDPDGQVTRTKWDGALLARDYAAAERAVNECTADVVQAALNTPLPKAYLLGSAALARGDRRAAASFFEAARPALEEEARKYPHDAFRHAQLGLIYAYIGRKAVAVREGSRAVELLPESADAYEGPLCQSVLAVIYARVGETDKALGLIERLLTTPAATSLSESSISLSDLRLRWQWDPLRKDPRFQKLLSGPEPQLVYH